MRAEELAFLEEMLENAALLACAGCQQETLHTHEEVLARRDGVTEVLMRCTQCMELRPWLHTE